MRNAKMTTLGDFKNIVTKRLIKNDDIELTEKIYKDLEKVQFDFENLFTGLENDIDYPETGFRQLKNGLPYLQCMAGGDWEYPVYFIIYWNGKELRAYVPEEGNTYDKKYKCAHGSQNESEDWPEDEELPEEPERKEDFAMMEQDIIDRIKII